MENQVYICENCGKEHDGSYGSGRFCCKSCISSFNAKKKNHICNWPSKKPKESGWDSRCGLHFRTRRLLMSHMQNCDKCESLKWNSHTPWNKGLTKETDDRVKKNCETILEKIKNGEINLSWLGKHHSEETKNKISESMKKAHAENRAYNIGTSRHNFEPSYPEKWFMGVIENEFENKNYIKEYVFHKFRLDFAWVEEKICIEIDGEQHERFEEQKIRDAEKDRLLLEEGWKELRIKWKDCIKNKKEWIEKAKALFN